VVKRRFRLERDLEDYCVREAHRRGYLTRKMNGRGFRAWPDRLVLWPRGNRQEFVEFKQPGEEPTTLQAQLHKRLRKRGCKVHVCDNHEHFQRILAA
jgi:hypothetical protein